MINYVEKQRDFFFESLYKDRKWNNCVTYRIICSQYRTEKIRKKEASAIDS